MCYYFDDIVGVTNMDSGFDFSDILLDKKLKKEKHENSLINDVSCKTSTGAKPLHIRFNKIDGFIKTHDGIRLHFLVMSRTRFRVNPNSIVA